MRLDEAKKILNDNGYRVLSEETDFSSILDVYDILVKMGIKSEIVKKLCIEHSDEIEAKLAQDETPDDVAKYIDRKYNPDKSNDVDMRASWDRLNGRSAGLGHRLGHRFR